MGLRGGSLVLAMYRFNVNACVNSLKLCVLFKLGICYHLLHDLVWFSSIVFVMFIIVIGLCSYHFL